MKGSDYCRWHHPEAIRRKKFKDEQIEKIKKFTYIEDEKPETPGDISEEDLLVIPVQNQSNEGGTSKKPLSEKIKYKTQLISKDKYKLSRGLGKKVKEKKDHFALFDLTEEIAILQVKLNDLITESENPQVVDVCDSCDASIEVKLPGVNINEILKLIREIKDLVKVYYEIQKGKADVILSRDYVDALLDKIVVIFMEYVPIELHEEVLERIKNIQR